MTSRALILIYHEIADGSSPLHVSPQEFEAHLAVLEESGATVLTVSALAAALRSGRLPSKPVCLTFDDGFASAVDRGAPRLAARGFTATVFCVAGRLGGTNDWPSQPGWVERRPLASAASLADLGAAGFELGAHGHEHVPLAGASRDVLHSELVEARAALEHELGVSVESLAYPYGSVPGGEGRELVRRTFRAACTATPGRVCAASDPWLLPRVPVHHVRRPPLLLAALRGRADAYLALRRAGIRLRERVGR